ncbi:MAG: type IV secretory system conjugative DNA transfer family protein [Deltaproteobacteria bacterium]|nr:type IV secretory system conjugative DNA transfer family protein [Deltaproteobacteria bacterium]
MIQYFEKLFLELLAAYFGLPSLYGLPLVLLGVGLLIVQWTKGGRAIFPGLTGLTLLIIEMLHFFRSSYVIMQIDRALEILNTPGPYVQPFGKLYNWLMEPIFSIFVAPYNYRHTHEEAFFVFIVMYLGLVAWHSWQEYKKTGVIWGDLSIKSVIQTETNRPQRSETNELGSGDLASTEQIARWTRSSGRPGDTKLYITEVKGSEGVAFKSADLVFPNGERNRHILAIAKTGSGKTTKLILPILYNDCLCSTRSTIVIDSKPEMWRMLAQMTRKYNPEKQILLFNPLDTVRSMSWNILSKIEDDTDAKLIANTIIMATDNPSAKADSPFFRNNALMLLNAIMVGLLKDPQETLSMPRIHELVQSGMKSLCDWLEQHPAAYRTSRTFVELARSESQNADTIMSELGMRLSAWDVTAVRATTAKDELDIEDLVNKPTLFIVEFRESELEMLRPMANVIVIELLRFLTKRAENCPGTRLPRPVSLVIDEFASALGRLPDIHVKLNTLRSRNVSIVGAIQSIAQVKANYGNDADSVLAGFSTKIMMPTLDIQDAEWASKESGQMTIRFSTSSKGSNRKIVEWFASKNVSTQEQVQQRAVLTPDEIGRPVDNRCTFFLPETPPFQGYLTPFYQIPIMKKRIEEFDNKDDELKLRDKPIEYKEAPLTPPPAGGGNAAQATGLPPGISNTKGWSDEQIMAKLEETRKALDWDNTTGSARKWWEAFEKENQHRTALVLRLAEELANRKATITEFFLAYVYSNTDNIQANLHYLDYTRLKKEEERKRREAAAKSGPAPAQSAVVQ